VSPLRFFARLSRREDGSAVVEYGILIGLIAAVAILGLDVLSRSTETALTQVSGALHNDVVQTTPGARQVPQPNTVAEKTLAAKIADQNLFMTALVWGALTLFAVIAAGIMWYKSQPKKFTLENAQEQAAEVNKEVKYVQPKLIAKRQRILQVLAENFDRMLRSTLPIRLLMSPKVATVKTDMSAADVKKLMQELEIRHVMVVNAEGQLVGVISDRDVKGKTGKTAAALMTANPITVSPDIEVSPAVTIMLDNSISSLPVVENGELRGVVTSTDLMMAVQCCLHLLRKLTDPNAAATLPAPRSGTRITPLDNTPAIGA